MLKEFSKIKLITDRHANTGALRGMIGCIIEVWGDGNYEAEFFNQTTGIDYAQIVVSEEDVELVDD